MSPTALVWFRRDLRLAGNQALTAAVANAPAVIPVFIWSPEEEAPWAPGAASRWWLHQSLAALQSSLRAIGSDLVIRRGPAAEALLQLAAETGANTVYWNRLYSPAETARDAAVRTALRARRVEPFDFPGALLREPTDVRNSSGKPFQVFTPFYKTYVGMGVASPSDPPERIPLPASWPRYLPLSRLRLEPAIDWAAGLRASWNPGEAGALRQLRAFQDTGLPAYSTGRDRPDEPGTSRLSPHLHFGEIAPHQIWHVASRRFPGAGTEAYLRQLVWREFAHHLLYHYPETATQPLRPEFRAFPWRCDPDTLRAWQRGRTGYPLVDAGMRELWHTGWMHNRVRMVVASFLVKHLLIPWQDGAAWFWDTLVDADLANNTLGWQWAAGCGADAAPYFRIFNPTIQAHKFDPQDEYQRRWIPELGQPAYPSAIVDHQAARQRALDALAAMKKQ
jgi:deoxyribodipyrimidine photo-lyase